MVDDLRVDSAEVTVDEIARGALRLAQPRRGYRFNVDALIVADFAARCCEAPPELVVDLGSGCGIVGLLLARRFSNSRVVLVELQPRLADLAAYNVRQNGLSGRVDVVCADLRDAGSWARSLVEDVLLVSNPPFYRLRDGRTSADPMVAQAKHELSCTLEQLLTACGAAAMAGGRLALIHDARRAAELERALGQSGWCPRRRQMVRPLPLRAAHRVLLLAEHAGVRPAPAVVQVREDEPLCVHQRPGVYSHELRRILER